jgi:hypothetical protein
VRHAAGSPGEPFYNPNFDETTGVTVNEILWNFFSTHPKKSARLG